MKVKMLSDKYGKLGEIEISIANKMPDFDKKAMEQVC